jgi:HCOMODA/2-hydroxy-3-carboxy-muconic semialdehyde decarboxylase
VCAVSPADDPRLDIARAARVLSALGLVTAYGHVSARAGTAMLITPAADLATVTGAGVVQVPLTADALPPGAPAEAWAHLALYRARPDAAAIARPSRPGPSRRRP